MNLVVQISKQVKQIEEKMSSIQNLKIIPTLTGYKTEDINTLKNMEKELSQQVHEYVSLGEKFEPFKKELSFEQLQEWDRNAMVYEYYRELGPNYDFQQDAKF